MTQEDKELLLKDLCTRLPYGVKVHCEWNYYKGERAREDGILTEIDFLGNTILLQRSNDQITRIPFNRIDGTVKPFLRPMSSMTEEERKDFYHNRTFHDGRMFESEGADVDWLNAHHFDYHGLIDKGLALEAPEGMYNVK